MKPSLFKTSVLVLLGRVAAAKVYNHVAQFSIDGFHASDLTKYVALYPNSTLATLLKTGYQYTDCFTTAPSDSFPGTLAPLTGANPRTTGVWYDVIWDRSYYDPGSNCTGPSDTTITDDETLEYNDTMVFSGGINPANLPLKLINGTCTPIYPHMRSRVNNLFEIIRSKGLDTAYTDKHAAYDLVRGPSGTGLSVGYFPEMAAYPNTINDTIAYDTLHVNAFLDWLNVTTPENSEGRLSRIPTYFGGNFQAVSVGQKIAGYENATGFPFTSGLLSAINFVDASLGQVVTKMKLVGIYNDTLISVVSKHGQTPINPALFTEVDPDALMNGTGVELAGIAVCLPSCFIGTNPTGG